MRQFWIYGRRLLEWILFWAIGHGIILFLATREIYPDKFVASMITNATEAPIWVDWIIAGIFGLLITFGLEIFFWNPRSLVRQSNTIHMSGPLPIVQNMPLSNEQKKQLIKSVIALKPIIKSIMINRSSSTRNTLWSELTEAFNRAGFLSVQAGFQEPTSPDETGVMLCIIDPNSPSEIDALMKNALEKIGIESKYIPLSEAQHKGDITIFVGPDPL
jgi:hypothetical protein